MVILSTFLSSNVARHDYGNSLDPRRHLDPSGSADPAVAANYSWSGPAENSGGFDLGVLLQTEKPSPAYLTEAVHLNRRPNTDGRFRYIIPV